jgi:hypothetical protein
MTDPRAGSADPSPIRREDSVSVTYEVYALKFAEHPGGTRGSFFFGPRVERPSNTLPVDYYFWLLRSEATSVVVDLGFTREVAERRGRTYLRSPEEALSSLGVEAADVPLVVVSHLHYDHAGCWAPFTSARFALQDEEMAFWTGRHLRRPSLRWLVELDDLQAYLALNHQGRGRGGGRAAPPAPRPRGGGGGARGLRGPPAGGGVPRAGPGVSPCTRERWVEPSPAGSARSGPSTRTAGGRSSGPPCPSVTTSCRSLRGFRPCAASSVCS